MVICKKKYSVLYMRGVRSRNAEECWSRLTETELFKNQKGDPFWTTMM